MLETDALGREHEFAAPPRRIVSLVPSWTETLFALGAGDSRRRGDRVLRAPRGARGAPRARRRHEESRRARDRRAAARPRDREQGGEPPARRGAPRGGGPARLRDLRARASPRRCASCARSGRIVARARAAADAIGAEVESRLAALAKRGRARGRARRRSSGATRSWSWAETPSRVTCSSAPAPRTRSPSPAAGAIRASTARALEAAAPDVLLLPTEPYRFEESDRLELLELACPAARNARIHIIEGELLSWYGPRMPRALDDRSARAVRRAAARRSAQLPVARSSQQKREPAGFSALQLGQACGAARWRAPQLEQKFASPATSGAARRAVTRSPSCRRAPGSRCPPCPRRARAPRPRRRPRPRGRPPPPPAQPPTSRARSPPGSARTSRASPPPPCRRACRSSPARGRAARSTAP